MKLTESKQISKSNNLIATLIRLNTLTSHQIDRTHVAIMRIVFEIKITQQSYANSKHSKREIIIV